MAVPSVRSADASHFGQALPETGCPGRSGNPESPQGFFSALGASIQRTFCILDWQTSVPSQVAPERQVSGVSLRQQLATEIQNGTSLTPDLIAMITGYAAGRLGAEEWLRCFHEQVTPQPVTGSTEFPEHPVASALPSLTTRIQEATGITSNIVEMISDYAIACFGALEWREYFHQDVGPVPELPESFYAFWNGPDPIDPLQKVRDTHLPPAFRPAWLGNCRTGKKRLYNLRELDQLAQNPRTALRKSRCFIHCDAITPQNGPVPAASASWIVMRKGVTGRNMAPSSTALFVEFLNGRTQAGYERLPSSIDLATAVFARYISTGERHLGDANGAEGRRTFACTIEKVGTAAGDRDCRVVGNFTTPRFMFPQAVLHFGAFGVHTRDCGIVLVRKFSGIH